MKPTRIGNRIVVIGSGATATERAACREPINLEATTRRIVVIKDGALARRTSKR
jgi:hypothetical protein